MKNNSVYLHRVIKASPEKVFRAFSDPLAYATWMPPYGFLATVQELDFRSGGSHRMTFINFSTGGSHSFTGKVVEVRPSEYIKYVETFDGPNLPGEMTTVVQLKPVIAGTELTIQQDGLPDAIPAEMCYLGWQESLEKLIRLVEPEIPDA